MTDDDICGHPTANDGSCQRAAGWGTERDSSPCRDHVQDRPVLREFSEETRQRILGAAESGAFKKHIAQVAEISTDTLNRWLDMGERDAENGFETDLAGFYRSWQRARGAGALQTLKECDEEFVAERAYGYTKTERREHLVDDEADLSDSEFEFEYVDE